MRFLLSLIAILAVLWLVALAHFLTAIPRSSDGDDSATDAIVVLTGGSLRLAYGFELLEKGKAKQLLITGVGADSTLESLLTANAASPKLRKLVKSGAVTVALDYSADSTRGNAEQTAKWMKQNNLNSLRLVTANYHVPRSLLEFHRAMPDAVLIAEPVFPEQAPRDLIMLEFHKYIFAWLFGILGAL